MQLPRQTNYNVQPCPIASFPFVVNHDENPSSRNQANYRMLHGKIAATSQSSLRFQDLCLQSGSLNKSFFFIVDEFSCRHYARQAVSCPTELDCQNLSIWKIIFDWLHKSSRRRRRMLMTESQPNVTNQDLDQGEEPRQGCHLASFANQNSPRPKLRG